MRRSRIAALSVIGALAWLLAGCPPKKDDVVAITSTAADGANGGSSATTPKSGHSGQGGASGDGAAGGGFDGFGGLGAAGALAPLLCPPFVRAYAALDLITDCRVPNDQGLQGFLLAFFFSNEIPLPPIDPNPCQLPNGQLLFPFDVQPEADGTLKLCPYYCSKAREWRMQHQSTYDACSHYNPSP